MEIGYNLQQTHSKNNIPKHALRLYIIMIIVIGLKWLAPIPYTKL